MKMQKEALKLLGEAWVEIYCDMEANETAQERMLRIEMVLKANGISNPNFKKE